MAAMPSRGRDARQTERPGKDSKEITSPARTTTTHSGKRTLFLPARRARPLAQGDRAGAAAVGMRVKRASPLSSALMEENAKASSDRGGNSPPSQLLSSCHSHFRCRLPRPPPALARPLTHFAPPRRPAVCLPCLPCLPLPASLSAIQGFPHPGKQVRSHLVSSEHLLIASARP